MEKECGCCKTVYKFIPVNAKLHIVGEEMDGFYFHCPCQYPMTTLFIPIKKVPIKEFAKWRKFREKIRS